ncbi:MAG: type II secretion system F family protein [Clostridia bacterium]|nr:MAG: type II secretion system F family protein [Clostridia bacterium]
MASYAYRARDAGGKLVAGILEAEHAAAVIDRLRQRQLFVVEVKPQAASRGGFSLPLPGRKVSSRDLAVFCRQLATMVSAGMPLMSCLAVLQRQSENSRLAEAAGGVRDAIQGGASLYEALSRYPNVFPRLFISMVEAGEVGGVLDSVLERMAEHYEKEHDLNEKVRSAMAYPAVVSVVAVVAVVFMITFILPTFTSMLTGMGAPLPLPTRIIMGLSDFMRNFWYVVIGGLAGAAFGLWQYINTDRGEEWKDRTLLRLPVFGPLVQKMAVSRFTRTLGTLVRGGVPILQALDVVKATAGNRVIAAGVDRARATIREGEGMARPLEATGVFPPMVTEMIAVGEETGALDTLLERISFFYDREVDAAVSRLSSMIEPILIVGLGGVVGFMVLSMMLPMFSLYGAVQ